MVGLILVLSNNMRNVKPNEINITLALLSAPFSLYPRCSRFLQQLRALVELCEVPADAPHDGLMKICKAGELAGEEHVAVFGLGRHGPQIFHRSPSHAHRIDGNACETRCTWS